MSRARASQHHGTPRAFAPAGCFAFALALLAAPLAGCGLHDVRVTVANDSGRALDSLLVRGEFGARRAGALAPGASVTVRFGVRGEDAIALAGRTADGGALPPGLATYVESGYRVRAVVDSALVVHWETPRGPY